MQNAHEKNLRIAQRIAAAYNEMASAQGISGRQARMDADETAMLALQLEQMLSRAYEAEYPELKARLFIPVSNEVASGANSFAFEETDHVGEAKILANLSDDPPSVEISGTKVSHAIVSIGDMYHYSLQDIRAAAFSGQPLSARKAIAARRAFERKLDEIAAVGAPDFGIASGLLNNSSVNIASLAAAGAWSTKAGSAMLDDLNALVTEQVTQSKGLYRGSLVLLPISQYLLASQTYMSTDNTESVLTTFQRLNAGIRVDWWDKLDGAGAGPSDRAVLFEQSPDVLELQIPQEFEVLPPQAHNYGFKTLCHGRTAGTAVYRPLGITYMDGI